MNIIKKTLTEKQWKSTCKALQGIAKQCIDGVVNKGVIRQLSNDRTAILEADLRSTLGSSSFTILNIKREMKRLKLLTGGVTVEVDQEKTVFFDPRSSYNVPAEDKDHLKNRFISNKEMDSMTEHIPKAATPLLKCRIEKKSLKEIRKTVSTFRAHASNVTFGETSASISVEGYEGSKKEKSSVEIIKNIPLSEPTTGYTILPVSPFDAFDYDGDVGWQVYRRGKKCFSKHYGSIGEVTVSTYTTGELKIDEAKPTTKKKKMRAKVESSEGGS